MKTIDIRNFGPIKEGAGKPIEINKVTVFIGDQGSGKSTVAKLVSVCSWIEKALVRGSFTGKEISRDGYFRSRCSYHNIQEYFKDESYIEYLGDAYKITYKDKTLSVSRNRNNPYQRPKIMYIPSERNFLSAVSKFSELKGLPENLFDFSFRYNEALHNMKEALELPVGNVKLNYDKLNDTVSLIGLDYKLRMVEAASGFQSMAPLYITSKYLSENNPIDSEKQQRISIKEMLDVRRRIDQIKKSDISEDVREYQISDILANVKNQCFVNIVEEPEQNLYPTSQKNILFELLKFNNRKDKNQLIITTHSPYLVSYLTLAIKAKELLELNLNEEQTQQIGDIIPVEASVSTDYVEIYEIKDGRIYRVKKYDGLPVDTNMLNDLLDVPNLLFDKLLDIEEQCQQTS